MKRRLEQPESVTDPRVEARLKVGDVLGAEGRMTMRDPKTYTVAELKAAAERIAEGRKAADRRVAWLFANNLARLGWRERAADVRD